MNNDLTMYEYSCYYLDIPLHSLNRGKSTVIYLVCSVYMLTPYVAQLATSLVSWLIAIHCTSYQLDEAYLAFETAHILNREKPAVFRTLLHKQPPFISRNNIIIRV